jgi:hypothetical protein
MDQWDPVCVLWGDAHGGDEGWMPFEEIDHAPIEVTTVGLLYKHDLLGITVVSSKVGDDVGGYMFIPAATIITVTPLEPKD